MSVLDGLEKEDFADTEEADGTVEPYLGDFSTQAMNVTTLMDEYDYDVEANINSFFWDELLPTLIVYGVTFILGLVGNILIIFTTLRYRKMKSTTNVFLASLASADLLLIVFCIPVKESNSLSVQKLKEVKQVENWYEAYKWKRNDLVLGMVRKLLNSLLTDVENSDKKWKKKKIFLPESECYTSMQEFQLQEEDLMNKYEKCTSEESKMEDLMVKLANGIQDCKDILRNLFSEEEVVDLSKFRSSSVNDVLANKPLTFICAPMIAYSHSSKELKRIQSTMDNKAVVERELLSDGNLQNQKFPESLETKKLSESTVKRGSLISPQVSSTFSSERIRSLNVKKSFKSDKLFTSPKTVRTSDSIRKSPQMPTKEFKLLEANEVERKLMKFEKYLKKFIRRTEMWKRRDQDRIQTCLVKLKETSETILKRLTTDWTTRDKSNKNKTSNRIHDGYQSEPEAAITRLEKKPIVFRNSGSEIKLNVGMELTMENYDSATGKKLKPEVSRNFQQEGNIKCKLLQRGEDPVTFIDTNFLYNTKTGMLFREGQRSPSNISTNPNRGPKPTKTYLLSNTAKPLYPVTDSTETSSKRKTDLAGQLNKGRPKSPSQNPQKRDQGTSTATSKSAHSGDLRLGIQRKVTKMLGCSQEHRKRASTNGHAEKSPSKPDELRRTSLIPIAKFSSRQGFNSHVNIQNRSTKNNRKIIPERTCHMNQTPQLAKLFSYTWTFGFFICKLVYYLQSVSAICSVLTLTAMSVERYYAIVHPMRAQYICTISQARRIITATWISSIFLAIPVLFAQIHMPVGVRVKGFWCVRDYDNPTIWRAHETYMLLLILIIPTGVMVVAYTTICLEIWHVMRRRQDLTGAKILSTRHNASFKSDNRKFSRKEKKKSYKIYGDHVDDVAHVKQVIKMLVAVVVIYVICWTPLLVDNILQAYGILPFMKFGKQKYMATAFHLMAYFNSCINPIVYGFMSKNFRESFRKTLFCNKKRMNASVRITSVSHERNTSIRYAESSFGIMVSIALPD